MTYTIFAFRPRSLFLAARTPNGDVGYFDEYGEFHEASPDFKTLIVSKYGYEPLVCEIDLTQKQVKAFQQVIANG